MNQSALDALNDLESEFDDEGADEADDDGALLASSMPSLPVPAATSGTAALHVEQASNEQLNDALLEWDTKFITKNYKASGLCDARATSTSSAAADASLACCTAVRARRATRTPFTAIASRRRNSNKCDRCRRRFVSAD